MTRSDTNTNPTGNGSDAANSVGADGVPKQADTEPLAPSTLTPQAQRALAEAEERRKVAHNGTPAPPEVGGRAGPDPVRYGDWEKGGIASDF